MTHPGLLSPLHTYCLLRILKRQPTKKWHKIYRFQSDLSSATIVDADDEERGFFNGQKLKQQRPKIMSLQGADVFPLCKGVNRYWEDYKMYPQYGDLQSRLFKHNRAPLPHLLEKQRATLLSRHWIESVRIPSAKSEVKSTKGNRSQKLGRLEESSKEPSRQVEGKFRATEEAREGEKRKGGAEDTRMEIVTDVSER